MTVDDVVRHVAETPGWYLLLRGIRRRLPDCGITACPISSLKDRPSYDYSIVVRDIGLDLRCVGDIVAAADQRHIPGSELYDLRRRLLEAAKLTELAQ